MFARAQSDEVSNIHKRWSFTRLGPSSLKASFSGSLACGAAIIILSLLYYAESTPSALVNLPLGIGVLAALHYVDYLAMRGTPVNKLSKVAHVSFFANILWMLTLLLGIAADFVFLKDQGHAGFDYIIAGMFLAAGLRVGIFTSVFGAALTRAMPVSFIQPLIFFLSFLPLSSYTAAAASHAGLIFGASLFVLGAIWSIVADRAGRPAVSSTFQLLQAFIAAWTEKDASKIEEFTEARSQEEDVETRILKFTSSGDSSASGPVIVLSDVHPGPFGPVGGSNLPYVLYLAFSKKALVLHSVSDHSLNIPSKREVEKYLHGLQSMTISQSGETCSRPIQITGGRATATGISFGSSAVIMLSLAPAGMEDTPQRVRRELESFGQSLGFSTVLLADCHNAMGPHLGSSDESDLISSASRCIEELKRQPQQKFKIGFASLEDAQEMLADASELGQAGIAVLVVNVEDRNYAIGWADSNNMENGLRDVVVTKVKNGVSMLELCSSDTHSTSGQKTRDGYFAFGSITSPGRIADAFAEISKIAASRAKEYCKFELLTVMSRIRVMGRQQFEDYSSALDKSMNVTKIFLGITAATYIAMLILS